MFRIIAAAALAAMLIPSLAAAQASTEPPIEGQNCPPSGSRSPKTTTQIQTTFFNPDGKPYNLYWVDFQGNSVYYGDVAPRGRKTLTSYLGHIWVAIDHKGRCKGYASVPRGQPTLAF